MKTLDILHKYRHTTLPVVLSYYRIHLMISRLIIPKSWYPKRLSQFMMDIFKKHADLSVKLRLLCEKILNPNYKPTFTVKPPDLPDV